MISQTALLCALARAIHSHSNKHMIFEDHFALNFIGLKDFRYARNIAKKILPESIKSNTSSLTRDLLNQYFSPIVLPRNRFAEDIVEAKQKKGKIQYVLLGAGLDSFSLRNKSGNVEVFELDLHETQTFKIERLKKISTQSHSQTHFVEIDFNKDSIIDKLISAGFDPNTPSIFSILGVSYYISIDVFFKTVSQVGQIMPQGSGLVFDYYEKENRLSTASTKISRLKQITSACGEVMVDGYDPSLVSVLAAKAGFNRFQDLSSRDIDKAFLKGDSDITALDGVHLVYIEKEA